MSTHLEKSFATIIAGAGVVFFGMIIASIFGVINQALLGRFLGPGDYGLFSLGISIVMIVSGFAIFGLGSAISQYIPANIKKGKSNRVHDSIRFSFRFCFGVAILLSIILFMLSNIIATKIFNNNDLEIVIKLLSIALPFTAFYRLAEGLPRGFKKAKYKVFIEDITMKVLRVSIFIILISFSYKLFGAIIAYLCAVIFASIAYLYITYYKFLPSLDTSFFKDKHRYSLVRKEVFSVAWPLSLAGFTYIFLQHTDRILLGLYMSSSDVGIYVAAFTIASLLISVSLAFTFLFLPVISEYFAERDLSSILKLFSSVTKWVFLITFPLVVYLILYCNDVIRLIYGESFLAGSSALIILSLGIAMYSLSGMAGSILIAIKKTKLNLIAEIIAAVSNVILNILLIPKYGIIGAAIGTSISISLRNISSLGFVYKELKIHPFNISYLKIAIISVISLAFISFVFKNYIKISWSFLIIIPIFLMIYFVTLFTTGCLNELDKSIIKTILKKIIKHK